MSDAPETPDRKGEWPEVMRLTLILLGTWFLVSFGAGILLLDFLDQFSFCGAPLGFWFAQNGSIHVFGTSGLYIGIALWARAGSTNDFCVAGHGVHPVVNGLATAADWMSAASFLSMAGQMSGVCIAFSRLLGVGIVFVYAVLGAMKGVT